MVRQAGKTLMPTWDICPPHTERGSHRGDGAGHRSAGFTLLELLVVLSIMGAVVALAVPAVIRSVDSWQRNAVLDDVAAQARSLPARARMQGRPIVLDDQSVQASGEEDGTATFVLPEGWRISVPDAWRVEANGACSGGQLLVYQGGVEWVLDVSAPFCEAARADE